MPHVRGFAHEDVHHEGRPPPAHAPCPPPASLVGCDRDAVLFLTLSEHVEEHLRAAAVQFEVAEFVDFEKVDAP